MRQLVKVTPLQEEEQILKEIENDNEDPDAIPDEFDVFLLECTQEEELSGLEKNVCLLNDLDDDAFDDDADDAEDYIKPEEMSIQHETNEDIQSIEVPIEQLCKEDNSTGLGESNKDSPDENLELESGVIATNPSLKVDVDVDLLKEVDSPNETTLKFSACIKGVTDQDLSNKHLATHSNVTKRRSTTKRIKTKPRKSHTCEICYSRFSRKYNFVKHMTTHLNKQPYTCYLCHKVYQLRHRLVSHLRRHTEEKIFTCDKCQTNFRYKKNLIIHLQLHTEKRYKCDICSAQFANKWYIQTHLRTHTSEKRFVCDFCDSKFKTKCDLETHERIHTSEKPFSCEQCPLTFADKSNQLSHMKAHNRVKLTCNICKKECQNISKYKRCFSIHMKTLAGEKLFTCLVCHNKFAKKGNLNTHMRTHTGEKPFACTVCDHRFAQKNDLVGHMRSHTGLKPYGCKLCEKKFAHKRNLRDHTERHEKAAH